MRGLGQRVLITVPGGVNKDDVSYTATQYTDADKIRFYRGFPQKIGGWLDITQETFGSSSIDGVPRSIYTFRDVASGVELTLIGTNTTLYVYNGDTLINITPIGSVTVNPGAGVLTTFFYSAVNNGIGTTNGSNTVSLTFGSAIGTDLQVGDNIFISGVSGTVGGIPAVNINGEQNVSTISGGVLTFTTSKTATSTTTGGGAAITMGTRTIRVADPNIYINGQRMKITGAVNTRGFTAAELNIEAIIRNENGTAFDYVTYAGFSTSAGVSAGDNISIAIQILLNGYCDNAYSIGYGGGIYGLGLYGESQEFTNSNNNWQLASIWSFDRFGEVIVMSPGTQQGIYTWDGNIQIAPIVLGGMNTPPYVNYVFTMGNTVAVLGPTSDAQNGHPNRLQTSASFQSTVWSDNTTDSFQIDFANTSQLIATGFVQNQYLIFTENNVVKLVYDGVTPWRDSVLYSADGALGQKAVVSVANAVVWVGSKNFYFYDGATVRVLPDNTIRQWFYDNLNIEQASKVFLWQNLTFNEIWLFFPFGGAIEPNAYVIWNFEEGHFTNGMLSRTAGENYTSIERDQFMANGSCNNATPNVIYRQEIQNNYTDNGNPMVGFLLTNDALLEGGQDMLQIERIIPSSNIIPLDSQNIGQLLYNLTIYTKEYDGQEQQRVFGPMSVYDNTQKLEIRANGRQWQYEYNFNNQPSEVGYPSNVGFRMGDFYAELKPVTGR